MAAIIDSPRVRKNFMAGARQFLAGRTTIAAFLFAAARMFLLPVG